MSCMSCRAAQWRCWCNIVASGNAIHPKYGDTQTSASLNFIERRATTQQRVNEDDDEDIKIFMQLVKCEMVQRLECRLSSLFLAIFRSVFMPTNHALVTRTQNIKFTAATHRFPWQMVPTIEMPRRVLDYNEWNSTGFWSQWIISQWNSEWHAMARRSCLCGFGCAMLAVTKYVTINSTIQIRRLIKSQQQQHHRHSTNHMNVYRFTQSMIWSAGPFRSADATAAFICILRFRRHGLRHGTRQSKTFPLQNRSTFYLFKFPLQLAIVYYYCRRRIGGAGPPIDVLCIQFTNHNGQTICA